MFDVSVSRLNYSTLWMVGVAYVPRYRSLYTTFNLVCIYSKIGQQQILHLGYTIVLVV